MKKQLPLIAYTYGIYAIIFLLITGASHMPHLLYILVGSAVLALKLFWESYIYQTQQDPQKLSEFTPKGFSILLLAFVPSIVMMVVGLVAIAILSLIFGVLLHTTAMTLGVALVSYISLGILLLLANVSCGFVLPLAIKRDYEYQDWKGPYRIARQSIILAWHHKSIVLRMFGWTLLAVVVSLLSCGLLAPVFLVLLAHLWTKHFNTLREV